MDIIPLYKGKRKNIIVIGGGGIKGLAALGSLRCLIDKEIICFPEIFAGTSVGSVICFLINIGYSPIDIYNFLEEIDFTKLIKYVEPENLLFNPCFGLSSPEPTIEIIYNFMKKKNINKNITFRELFLKTQSKLIITGTCVNDSTITYFSVDTYPEMQILKAIRISISIPFIFRPYLFENKLWVDGGCMNNFPIDLFNDKLNDVIGIYMDDLYESNESINEIEKYFYSIFKCIWRGMNYNKLDLFKKYIINIIIPGNHGTNWDISQEEKKKLYNLGYENAEKFINSQEYYY